MNDAYNELIRLYIVGDHEAFETLVKLYRSPAENFAKKCLIRSDDAEDIVQDAFVVAYVKREQFNPKYQFKTYLYTIIRNKCVDHIRKEARVVFGYDFDMISIESPEDLYIIEEKKKLIQQQLDALSNTYQMAIYLVDVEAYTYSESAQIMNKSLASFKVTLMRARKQLKKQIERMAY